MSDIEDYFSGNESDSVTSTDSDVEKNTRKKIKSVGINNTNTLKINNIYEEENALEKEEDDIEDMDDIDEDDDDDNINVELLNDDDDDVDEDDDEDDDDEDDDEDDEDYYDEQDGGAPKTTKKTKKNIVSNKKPVINSILMETDNLDEGDEDDDNDDNYLQKFDQQINKNYVKDNHPECIIHNYEEVRILTDIVRDSNNIIIDPFHKTIPFLTKYEKARVLGQRAKQIECGSKPFVKITENIIDGYIIAELELQQKKIPFIIRRPLPNGACEYWNLRDLEIINF